LIRTGEPAGTEIRDSSGVLLAQLTDGARTVVLAGPTRTFREPGVEATVTSDRWVRLLPSSYDGHVDDKLRSWLSAQLADQSPDLLAIASQYLSGAPSIKSDGLRIAGDATYELGADFNDYLGIDWTYGTETDEPEREHAGALDCSGFVRLVLGYRLGLRMSLEVAPGTLPRKASDQLDGGPGQLIVADSGTQITTFDDLRPGDLVFFDASEDDGRTIDHDGIYLGIDNHGDRRFISSRLSADGPTIGDVKGASIVNGSGYWAVAFRAVRRP
jgi:hypothetical protein